MARRRARSGRFQKSFARIFLVALLGLIGYGAKSMGWLPNGPAALESHTHPTVSGPDGVAVVERVVDGDTLVIRGGERIRLIGVDTPETKHPDKRAQPFGQEAFEFTRRMAEGKQVQIRFDPGESKDRYGRTLAYVYVDGELLNERLIREGLGRAILNYPFSADMKMVFRNAESAARSARRGVWSQPRPAIDLGEQPSSNRAG